MKPRFKHETPLDLYASLPECAKSAPVQPIQRPKYHSDECYCTGCADLRAAITLYIEHKRIYELNGFI